MMDVLQGIGYGIVALAILVVVGIVVITNLGGAVGCSGNTVQGSWNSTSSTCSNATANVNPTGDAWTTGGYLSDQLGSTGLSGWVPAIIAVAVGALFLSYFLGRRR